MRCNHILYLASGSSRRFGSNKLLYCLDGKPMYLWSLEMLRDLVEGRKDCTLTVVSRYEEIRKTAEAMGLHAVDSPDSELGLSHTIRAGINALHIGPEDYLLFVVADQPYLKAASVERLLAVTGDCGSLRYGDRPGNPTLFASKLVPELLELTGDTGGRAVLKNRDCIFVNAVDSRELEDIDTR